MSTVVNISGGQRTAAKSGKRSLVKKVTATGLKSASKIAQQAAGKGLIKGKAGQIIGKIGGLAARYGGLIPGVGTAVAAVGKVAESVNDPEWWQNVPGTGVSTNVPLQMRDLGAPGLVGNDAYQVRPTILEFSCLGAVELRTKVVAGDYTRILTLNSAGLKPVIHPTENMVATYLMKEVRKVVNAIPLQATNTYRDVFANNCTAMALKHQLDKFIHLSQHTPPHIITMTDGSYEILDPSNYAILVGLRDRLKEYLSASVRLPHTVCQYLAWRFGRIYRTGDSEKSGIVMYNVLPLCATLADYQSAVAKVLGFSTSADSYFGQTYTGSEKSQAQVDLFNAYLKHTCDVPVEPDTQLVYDRKEWVLRTNLDVASAVECDLPVDVFYMDSALDNKTTFMASTISSRKLGLTALERIALFPIDDAFAYFVGPGLYPMESALPKCYYDNDGETFLPYVSTSVSATSWFLTNVGPVKSTDSGTGASKFDPFGIAPWRAAICKALEYYNAEIYLQFQSVATGANTHSITSTGLLDLTAPSTDMAIVSDEIIANTQTYAFANLVYGDAVNYKAQGMPGAIQAASETASDIRELLVP